MDGAMGTELLRRYRSLNTDSLATVTLSHPSWVRSIHRSFLRSGAQCLLTNTFLAWPREANSGNRTYFCKLNRLAVQLARESAAEVSRPVPIVASIGPWPNDSATSVQQCLAQIYAVRDADAVLLETQSSLAFIERLLAQLPSTWPIPILVSFTFLRRGKRYLTLSRQHTPAQIADWAERRRSRIAVLGTNCGCGLTLGDITKIVRLYRRETGLPILVRPNAGTPKRRGKRHVYPFTPEDFAAAVPDWLEAGATWLGGCCGSTPRHIAAMRRALRKHLQTTSPLQ
jgi:methionine synthase I (cobalamin-dependent)